jgi:triosephosphate isomerase
LLGYVSEAILQRDTSGKFWSVKSYSGNEVTDNEPCLYQLIINEISDLNSPNFGKRLQISVGVHGDKVFNFGYMLQGVSENRSKKLNDLKNLKKLNAIQQFKCRKQIKSLEDELFGDPSKYAFTGEIAPSMLTNIGVSYVIIGHSERRAMFNETDETCNKKVHQAFNHGLVPILCVGESLEQREAGTTNDLLTEQLEKDLAGLTKEQVEKLVIAYEPIWAIGTGKTATAEVADETCGFIRETVKRLYDEATAEAIRIQYGGSVKTSNIDELMAKPNIDGALIGGASLKAEDFVTLVTAAVK